jgi:hypothetical protein
MQHLILKITRLKFLNKTANTFEITMPSNSAASTSGTGSAQIDPYEIVGPTFQTAGLGWGNRYMGF